MNRLFLLSHPNRDIGLGAGADGYPAAQGRRYAAGLGPNVVDICVDACKAAKARGIKISCDLNYRGKLWTRDEARAAMTDLCQYVDVCISNEE